jgi:hypothetical protein
MGGRGGGPIRQELKLVEKFDKDGDQKLNAEERKAAREYIAKEKAEGRLGRGPGGPGRFGGPGGPAGPEGRGNSGPGVPSDAKAADGAPRPDTGAPGADRLQRFEGRPFGRRENQPPPEPGRKLTVADVKSYPAAPLYDSQTLRTLFFEFEGADWEKELSDFHNTDVEVPAKLVVDGKTYKDVGVHFRGMSSFMMIGEGRKKSMGVKIDFEHEKQDIDSYQTLDLLNSNDDPSFLRAVLFCQIAREYVPAPKANLVRVVINGECWGVYVNKQHFNKDFLKDWYDTKKGVRWKVPGSPGGGGGLEYLGDKVDAYKARYELKSKEDPKAWTSLINLCRVLNETPAEQLEEKLAPILDIDGALRFLALDNALVNNDGYWVRASDYSLYEDEQGRFHVIPHDVNETFSMPGGPGFGGGPMLFRSGEKRPDGPNPQPPQGEPAGGPVPPAPPRGPQVKGVELDPLVSVKDAKKPLLSKLLAVPALRERYLAYIKDIAEKWLDWEKLGPIAKQYGGLIAEDVRLDTRKLESTAAFEKSIEGESEAPNPEQRGPRRSISLKSFAEQRRAYLLNHPEVKKAGLATAMKR